MRLYLDTEFNGFGGELISMALVPDNNVVPEFYREISINNTVDPWVKENVMPNLVLVPCSYYDFQKDLEKYLWSARSYDNELYIVVDWPDDIRYFCEALITGPGMRLNTGKHLLFELDYDISYKSQVPHNALHDARAIRESCRRKHDHS